MPTENRSSNTEMAEKLNPCPFCGQQDAFVEQLDSDASVVICQGKVDEHSACLARGPVGVQQEECEDQPGRDQAVKEWNKRAAQQHQGEPVAWLAKTLKGALAGTLGFVRPYNRLNPDLCEGPFPVFRHADPAEVERLREVIKHSDAQIMRQSMRISNQRAQLAELWRATNLLMKVTPRNKGSWADKLEAKAIIERLSASAEPSAPVEIDEQPEFVRTVTAKLQRFLDCAEDGQGADIGREWFDVLTKLGLLRRVQRSPAWWEMTEQGDALLVRAALEHKS